MIISASRRTDIPSYYTEWFFNRIQEGFVYTRNPMNIRQISKISLSPDVIDGIVFWTKNPIPMIPRLNELKDYPYYFQFTINPYGKDIEANVPNKNNIIIPAFHEISQKIGSDRVIWRYDPILISQKYSMKYHIFYFEEIAKRLEGYTKKCIISFVDLYRNTQKKLQNNGIIPLTEMQMMELAKCFSGIAEKYGFVIESCSEEINLEQYGISHGHCIDDRLLEKICGYKLDLTKDKNQRQECGCVSSIDIGAYNTCKNGCAYCYANNSDKTVQKNYSMHNPMSPLIFGEVGAEDIVKERIVRSCKQNQLNLFDI